MVCSDSKQRRLSFPDNKNSSKGILDTVHKNICVFIDDYIRMTCIYFLKNKNDTFESFRNHEANVENQSTPKIKILRQDIGKEFCNKEFHVYLSGLIRRLNAHEQNGLTEQFSRTVIEKVKYLLDDAEMRKSFSTETAKTFTK